jgi:hypothetical protein
MGCGCKKKAASLNEPIKQPTNVQVTIDETQVSGQNQTLNDQQQQAVDNIIDKLRQINQ